MSDNNVEPEHWHTVIIRRDGKNLDYTDFGCPPACERNPMLYDGFHCLTEYRYDLGGHEQTWPERPGAYEVRANDAVETGLEWREMQPEVSVYRSQIDDAVVVDITTTCAFPRLRINLNTEPVFDADPNQGDHHNTVLAYAADLASSVVARALRAGLRAGTLPLYGREFDEEDENS